MKRLLVILGEYLEGTAQNGLCIKGLVDYWEESGVEVDIVCKENKGIETPKMNVHPITTINKSNKLIKNAKKMLNIPIGDKKLVNLFAIKIKQLMHQKDFDAMIAVINPTETAEALYKVKKYNLKTILYEIDPTSNRYKNPQNLFQHFWKAMSMKWEKKIYNQMDYIIHMKTHKKHYSNEFYKEFAQKTYYMDIPCFDVKDFIGSPTMKANRKIKLLYAGAFYPVLREPYYMIELFSLLKKHTDIVLSIYTGANMKKELNDIANKHKSFISLYDVIPKKKLKKIIMDSDILVSVGNSNSDFLPSKILSYMSTGKPVIHFYSDEYDVSLLYLRRYPLCLLIDQNKLSKDNISRLISFLDIYENEKIDVNQLMIEFADNIPENSAREILDLI